MDDQFSGRTDDNLFYDELEPVERETIIVQESQPQPQPEPQSQSQSQSEPTSSPAPAEETAKPKTRSRRSRQHKPKEPSPSSSHGTPLPPRGDLASSRFARKGNANMKQSPSPQGTQSPKSKPSPTPAEDKTPTPPENAPKAPRQASTVEARMKSGANPRQKLTDAELSAKMEQMKLLSAEKERKFEKAEKDEKQHAAAYARGMEEARKRRAEEAERRRRGEEDKRKLDDERAKNRERKLKAMSTKEGGWDEGKEEQDEPKRAFRGANGGVRGLKRGGLGGSRYAAAGEEVPDVDRFLEDRDRGRGQARGRGRGGRGRGGPVKKAEGATPAMTTEEFPALPGDAQKKPTPAVPAAYPPVKPLVDLPLPLPKGTKWDDEMEEMDSLQQKK